MMSKKSDQRKPLFTPVDTKGTLVCGASTVGIMRLRKGILRFTRIQWPIRIDGVSVDAQ